jgi:hypothetical protein
VREALVSSDPWAQPNPLIFLLILAVALLAVPGLGGHGVAVLVRGRRRRDRVLRGLAEVAFAATIAVYAFGAMSMFRDESGANAACQQAVGPAHSSDIAAYEISFLPVRFGCRVDRVGTWQVFVPGFVNPAVLALSLVTVLLVALAWRAAQATPIPSTSGDTTS